MATVLIVTNPFGGREAGERITDPAEMEKILSSEHAHHVVRAVHDDVPAPDTPSKPSKKQE